MEDRISLRLSEKHSATLHEIAQDHDGNLSEAIRFCIELAWILGEREKEAQAAIAAKDDPDTRELENYSFDTSGRMWYFNGSTMVRVARGDR